MAESIDEFRGAPLPGWPREAAAEPPDVDIGDRGGPAEGLEFRYGSEALRLSFEGSGDILGLLYLSVSRATCGRARGAGAFQSIRSNGCCKHTVARCVRVLTNWTNHFGSTSAVPPRGRQESVDRRLGSLQCRAVSWSVALRSWPRAGRRTKTELRMGSSEKRVRCSRVEDWGSGGEEI